MLAYEKLDSWKVCHELVLATYRVTGHVLADDEDDVLRRLRRCALRSAGTLAFGAGAGDERQLRISAMRTLMWLSEYSYVLQLVKSWHLLRESDCANLDALRGRGAFYTTRLLLSVPAG